MLKQKKFLSSLQIKTSSLPDKIPLYVIKNNNKVCGVNFEAKFGINRLEIEFLNKGVNDTMVNESGEIVADLTVEIQNLIVDEVDLTTQLKTNGVYVTNDGDIENTYGFLHKNGKFTFEFICPPFLFLRNLEFLKNKQND